MSTGTRRLRLVGAPARSEAALTGLSPVLVRERCVAIGETRPDSGAHAFALELAQACLALGDPALVALFELASDAGFASAHLTGLNQASPHVVRASISDDTDMTALIARARAKAPDSPWLFVGEPAVIALAGVLKVVIDRPGGPATLSARARSLKAAAHLVLSSPRAGLARQLAQGFLLPTTVP